MRYAAANYLGDTPATSYQDSKLILLNADLFFLYPRQVRQFIARHEEGHIKLNTDSEIEADNYAFKQFKGKLPHSLRWAVLSVSRVLPFNTKEQYLRLINMYKNALTADSYETGSSLPYEASYLNKLADDVSQMTEAEWKQKNNVDLSTGETSQVRQYIEPVGEFVNIAREAWTKAKLGYELSGYDLTILDKYPMPADFEAYEVDENELFVDDPEDPEETENLGLKDVPGYLTDFLSIQSTGNKKSLPGWVWFIIAGFVLLLIFKR